MREYKFRGIRIDNGKWIIGSLANFEGQTGIWGTDVINGQAIIDKVYPKTVGQYTGLKDKNGVEIYEGDILKLYRPDIIGDLLTKVLFNDGCFDVVSISDSTLGRDYLKVYIANHACEVIGNIHQNPEY